MLSSVILLQISRAFRLPLTAACARDSHGRTSVIRPCLMWSRLFASKLCASRLLISQARTPDPKGSREAQATQTAKKLPLCSGEFCLNLNLSQTRDGQVSMLVVVLCGAVFSAPPQLANDAAALVILLSIQLANFAANSFNPFKRPNDAVSRRLSHPRHIGKGFQLLQYRIMTLCICKRLHHIAAVGRLDIFNSLGRWKRRF